MRPAWWRARAPRRVRVDDRGAWHFEYAGGAWRTMVPDCIDTGPGHLWLTLAGGGVAGRGRRWRVTLWSAAAEPAAWRKLRIAALWRMQRARPAHE